MSPREIFLKALKREKVPRPATGSATSIVTVDLMKKADIYFPEAHLYPVKMAGLAAAGFTEIGFDNVMPLFSVWHESSAMGCKVNWGEINSMPDCREHLYKIDETITIPKDLLDKPGCKVPIEAIKILKRRYGDEIAVVGKVFGPWTLGYHMFGVEEFLINTSLKPGKIKKAMDILKKVTIQFGRAQIEAGADALCLADHCTKDLCSPDTYRDFLKETHRELKSQLKCPLILHICGDTSDRIKYIRQTGIDCFHFDSKVPAKLARELAGTKLALMGGTSNFSVVRTGSPETIQKDVRDKVNHRIDIIGPECAVLLDAPCCNLKLLAEEAKRQKLSL